MAFGKSLRPVRGTHESQPIRRVRREDISASRDRSVPGKKRRKLRKENQRAMRESLRA